MMRRLRTFSILSARNLEELLDVGDFGRHLGQFFCRARKSY